MMCGVCTRWWIGDKAEKVPKAQEAKAQQQIRPRKAWAVDPARLYTLVT